MCVELIRPNLGDRAYVPFNMFINYIANLHILLEICDVIYDAKPLLC